MRILVVSTWYPDQRAPFRTPFIVRHVHAIARDHDVRVVHVNLLRSFHPVEEEHEGVRITRAGFDPRRPLSMARVWRLIHDASRSADVVHTMAFSSALVAAPGTAGTPWVHTEHWNGVLFPEYVNRLWERAAWLRHILRLPRVVTGVSTLMTETLRKFTRPGATRLVGNVVECRAAVAPRPANPLRLVGVRAVTEHKGAELAVDTVAWLRDHGHDASLVWAGDGPRRSAALARAHELGVAEHVAFPGFRTTEQLWDDLAGSSMFVLPTKSETFCVAAAEALAAGRPVVMGARGGQRDFITSATGRTVAERIPEAFAAAILEVAEDPGIEPAEEMAAGIRSRYGVDAVARQFTEIYQRVVR